MAAEGVIRVSSKALHGTYVNAAKAQLQSRPDIQLHGLGEAITNTVRAADSLISLGYATLRKLETQTLTEPDEAGVARKRAKVVITLAKAPTFNQALEEFEQSRSQAKP